MSGTPKISELLTLAQAARVVNKSPNAIWRWCKKGVSGVRLEHVVNGREIKTTEAWLMEFMAALAVERLNVAHPPSGEEGATPFADVAARGRRAPVIRNAADAESYLRAEGF